MASSLVSPFRATSMVDGEPSLVNHSANTITSSSFPFLSLAAELRMMVYKQVRIQASSLRGEHQARAKSSILRTSTTICHDAFLILFPGGKVSFTTRIGNFNILREIGRDARNLVREVEFDGRGRDLGLSARNSNSSWIRHFHRLPRLEQITWDLRTTIWVPMANARFLRSEILSLVRGVTMQESKEIRLITIDVTVDGASGRDLGCFFPSMWTMEEPDHIRLLPIFEGSRRLRKRSKRLPRNIPITLQVELSGATCDYMMGYTFRGWKFELTSREEEETGEGEGKVIKGRRTYAWIEDTAPTTAVTGILEAIRTFPKGPDSHFCRRYWV